jgi:hypothetical protein
MHEQTIPIRIVMKHQTKQIIDSNVGTVSQTVRSGNGLYIEKNHARPALYTVFSTTQLGYLITQLVFLRSRIWKCFHSKEQRSQT